MHKIDDFVHSNHWWTNTAKLFFAFSFKACPCTEDTLSSEIKETLHHLHAQTSIVVLHWLSQEKTNFIHPNSLNLCVFIYIYVVHSCGSLLGSALHRDSDQRIGSNFGKFYHNRISFTLGELVSLVKVFRLFRLERIVLVFRVWTQYVDVQHITYRQGQRVCDALFYEKVFASCR
jgi:hypothetical protein